MIELLRHVAKLLDLKEDHLAVNMRQCIQETGDGLEDEQNEWHTLNKLSKHCAHTVSDVRRTLQQPSVGAYGSSTKWLLT